MINKIALATLCLALAFFLACSDLPDPAPETNNGGTVSSSSSTNSSSSSTTQGSSSAELSSAGVVPNSSSSNPNGSSTTQSSSSTGLSSSSVGGSSSSVVSSSSSVAGSSGSVAAVKIWNKTADTTWYTSNKEKTTAYLINTAEQLAGLALLVNGSANNGRYDMYNKTIKLDADIMLNDTTGWKNWEDDGAENIWTPIGTESYGFRGIFNGNNHVVSGVYIPQTPSSNGTRGLFGRVSSQSGGPDAKINALGVVAFYIYGTNDVGGIVGTANTNTITISNSYSNGIIKATGRAGGLVGYMDSRVSISNCYSATKVTRNTNSGGLVGMTASGATIENSYYDKNTSGQSDEGKGVGKTTEEMKAPGFAATLGEPFIYNEGGYPKLKQE